MLRIQVTNPRERQQFDHLAGPLEFGRGGPRTNVARCMIQDLYVSKDHVQVLELPDGRVRIENLSQRNSIRLSDGAVIATGGVHELDLPAHLGVGETVIELRGVRDSVESQPLQTVAAPLTRMSGPAAPRLHELGGSPAPEMLAHWFETVIAVQRAAAGSPEFYAYTARAVVELVGLDRGLILLRRDGRWLVQARCPEGDSEYTGCDFSLTILDRMERERRTFFQSISGAPSDSQSLTGVESVVAAPVFDPHDQVVGAVYGCRTRWTPRGGLGIGPLEAQVVQLLAAAVGVGLARMEQEEEAARLRVQFEQFFSADLARELQKNPRLLEGQEREVTVLFCDIRGFSRLAERLGPTDSCRLVADVMEAMTARVREHDGVVVDYAGDGLMAMWNAPAEQPDHAAKACRAALAALGDLPRLNVAWKERLGVPLHLGVGLNTGQALCGNTGSRLKFKYGPLGHTVNLASRVEGATKHLGIPLLITGSTHARLGGAFATRRLCRARLVGIREAVDLHELYAESAPPEWLAQRETYERGLALFEAGDWAGAYRVLNQLPVGAEPHDVSTLYLIRRTLEMMGTHPEHFDGVLELKSK
jgi:adenylate cyclase